VKDLDFIVFLQYVEAVGSVVVRPLDAPQGLSLITLQLLLCISDFSFLPLMQNDTNDTANHNL